MVESSENKRQRPNVTFRVDEESDRKKIRADRPENELEEGYELDYLLEDGPFEQRSKRKSLKDQGTDSESAEEDQEASADSGDSISDGGSKSSASKDDTGRVMGEVLIQEHDYTEDGIKITPFNMAEELEDGTIDESGHYVAQRDKDAAYDNWLLGITKADVEKARESHNKFIERQKQAASMDDSGHHFDLNETWLKILVHLKPGESVAKAMRRLSPQTKIKKWLPKWKAQRLEKHASAVMQCSNADEKKTSNRVQAEALNELVVYSSHITDTGQYDTLELTYEQIVRKLRIAGVLPDTWMPLDPLPIT